MRSEKRMPIKETRPPHVYRRYPLGGEESAASLMLGRKVCGIYIYRFSDDSWYVGQTVNLAARHQQHLHEYRHEKEYEGIELVEMYFMEVDPDLRGEFLDAKEVEAIQWADSKGLRLHNRLITGRPRGEDVAELLLEDGTAFSLPMKRTSMTQGNVASAELRADKFGSLAEKARKLMDAPFYDEMLDVLGSYISNTVHEAAAGVGRLWSVSALPSTNGGARLLTLSVSNLETAYILGSIDGGIDLIRVNCKRPEEDKRIAPPLLLKQGLPRKTEYRVAEDVVAYDFNNLDQLRSALEDERFLDWCYRLNIELMRKSPTFHTKGFNPNLACDLLKASEL